MVEEFMNRLHTNETEFIGKANLMVKSILNSYTLNRLNQVSHFMVKDLYENLMFILKFLG